MDDYFSPEELNRIADTVLQVVGYDNAVRAVAVGGLPVPFRALMPGGMAAPAISVRLDLQYLNSIRRLRT